MFNQKLQATENIEFEIAEELRYETDPLASCFYADSFCVPTGPFSGKAARQTGATASKK